jgi:hypothetical protein
LFETTTRTQARSIPTSQWQYKAGLTNEKPELDEEEQIYENLWEEQSYEDYYSTQESVELNTDSEEESLINEVDDNPDIYVTRSGIKSKPPERLQYDDQSCLITLNDHEDQESWSEHHLLAFKASTDPDTMYQAMKQPDREKFKECEAYYKEGNYKLIKRDKLPEGATLLSSVWQMKRKRKQSTGEISNYKARMNADGSQMIKGIYYEETYAPVVQMGNNQILHFIGNTQQLA